MLDILEKHPTKDPQRIVHILNAKCTKTLSNLKPNFRIIPGNGRRRESASGNH
jgi:hypothetical protein